MATEVQRVGKRWFVTSPNPWYPFEFHSRLPFVSWLPAPLMHLAIRVLAWNHESGRYTTGMQADEIRLLNKRKLRELFPSSVIISLRVTFYPETLLTVGPTPMVKRCCER